MIKIAGLLPKLVDQVTHITICDKRYLVKSSNYLPNCRIIMLIDVSLTERLAQSNAELQMKKDMMQNLRHEIRNILNILIGNLQNMMTDCNNSTHMLTTKIALELSNIATLTLKNYSMLTLIENKTLIANYRSSQILNRIDSLTNTYQHFCTEKNVIIKKIISNVPKYICIDEDIYMQIFYNILSNSVKYTFNGDITIIVSSQNNILTTQIVDTGIGITDEKQNSIYSMFSNSTSADATGIGIGLYLSKHLLNFLHGDLFIESKFNRGTDIMFWVPQENYEKVSDCDIPNKAPKIISFPSEIRGSFEHKIKPVIKESSNIGILVVDDNAMCLTVLKALLTQLNNYILFSAYNGKQAVDLYKENKDSIRLVLMDLNMPVLNGIDSCKEMLFLQQQNGWPFIDIVAVSAQDDYFYMKEANNAGMKAFLRKPVSLNALRSILNELKLL